MGKLCKKRAAHHWCEPITLDSSFICLVLNYQAVAFTFLAEMKNEIIVQIRRTMQ